MNISFHTVKDNLDITKGYGAAGMGMVTAMQELGHKVPFDSADSPVQISFCQPAWWKFHPGQYRIGYLPWESTELPDGWVKRMNEVDEVWATSDWVANVFADNGVKKPIYVYEHGLDPVWKPIQRKCGDTVKYLVCGEPAIRKGGQIALDAFRAVFGESDKAHLTVKAYHTHFLRAWVDGELSMPEGLPNVTVIKRQFNQQEMVELYSEHDVLIYPTSGEGFGFIPLQALGTGMPVISTGEWAPYRRFLYPMEIPGAWERSIWSVHPGNVLYPDYDVLKMWLRYSFKNLEQLHEHYYAQAPEVHTSFNWISQTRPVFEDLEKRLAEK